MTNTEFLLWEQASRDTIDLKRIYIDIAGDLVTGVLLSQIIYWNLPNKEGKSKLRVWYEGKLWLAKGREDWWEECRISPKQFDRSIKILENKELIETALKKFNGSPTKHICLNINKLLEDATLIYNKQTEGKMDFDQRVKSNLTKGEKPIYPNSKMDSTEKLKSITKTTPKTTSKTTSKMNLGRVDNFNNFEQRTYDYDELEKKLLGWDK